MQRGLGVLLAGACVLTACRREGAVQFGSSRADAPVGQVQRGQMQGRAPSDIGGADVVRVAGVDSSPVSWRPRGTPYPLDSFGRSLPVGQLSCPSVDARDFAGQTLRFSRPAKVIEPFRQRLLAFEQVVREVSERVYARWPSAILVAASYGCRSVGDAGGKLSEHALGNAIDIMGFEFAPTPLALPAWAAAALPFLGGFQVRVDRHWKATGDAATATHAYFLSELTRELLERDIFRTLLGPAHPDHDDHFHFDMAPSNYVHL